MVVKMELQEFHYGENLKYQIYLPFKIRIVVQLAVIFIMIPKAMLK